MVVELFAQLERVLDYDGNPESRLVVRIGEAQYGPEESLASIGLYGGEYLVALETA